MELEVAGKVAGLDAAGFEQAAQKAEHLCLVSGALRQNVAIQLHVRLEAWPSTLGWEPEEATL